jgi:hypothetical protein
MCVQDAQQAAIEALLQELDRQNKTYGDAHDQQHSPEDWAIILTKYTGKICGETPLYKGGTYSGEEFKRRLIQVAGIAISAWKVTSQMTVYRAIIRDAFGDELARLTTEHEAPGHEGRPVLVVGSETYGPEDWIEDTGTGPLCIRVWIERWSAEPSRTEDERRLATAFLAVRP